MTTIMNFAPKESRTQEKLEFKSQNDFLLSANSLVLS